MNLTEYTPKQYLLIELPYSKIIMNASEAIGLDNPVGAFIVPEQVWRSMKNEFMLNQLKLSGEITSSFAPDGTEWLDCPSPSRHSVRTKHISSTSRVSKLLQSPRVIEGLCGCCGDSIYDDLARCDGCNKVVCINCTHKIAGYIFCTTESCTNSDTHWKSMREDGLKIETDEHPS
jgi:hypothetical protein